PSYTKSVSWHHYREDLLVAATLLAQNLFTHGYALGKL
ncbi:TPA: hypothetical protein ACNEDP_004574, partial [Escherichia coli]